VLYFTGAALRSGPDLIVL